MIRRVTWLLAPLALAVGLTVPLIGATSAAATTGLSYHFPAPPIASAGSIGPGGAQTFNAHVYNNGVSYPFGPVYLGYFQGGNVAGDSTAVPASQCGVAMLPPSGSYVKCTADAKGIVALTYHVPAQPPAQGHASWIAEDAPNSTNNAIEHYVYTTVYRFTTSPIAASGSLAAGAIVPVTLSAQDGLNVGVPNAQVYLSLKRATGGGGAAVGSTPLTATPALFTATSSGLVQITYAAPSSLPAGAQDMIVVQDLSSKPTETNSDSYAFSASAPVVSVGDATVFEGDQQPGIPAQFTVTVSPVQTNSVTVQYVSLCGIGDKVCSEDFTQVTTPVSVTIPANTSGTTILVRQFSYIGGNAGETYKEGWYAELSNPSVGVLGRSVGTGMLLPDIENSNTALALLYTGSAGAVPCTNAGGVPIYFTVTLGAATAAAVTFSYATADGTAVAGTDYAAVSGTATIPGGKTSAVIKVVLSANSPPTSDKSFSLTITNAIGGPTISSATGTGTVLAR